MFSGRILSIDEQVIEKWAELSSVKSQSLPVVDGFLAATALAHKLTLVTRNTKDFQLSGATLFNPW